ncbi:MAG: 3-deoxy-manno-octulosonate cytidylyltransferase [Nitrospira sp.]|nr:3-deoxy-manno-octulosonate cytidylyltransferase [Nitrospira sp.]
MPWGRAEVPRSVTVVIPARYGSSRFPGKPLIDLLGKPMIQHVYEQAKVCRAVDDVLVATDDDRIKRAVEGFGGQVLMMTEPYRTGTDRVAAVAKTRGGDCYIDLQGDEILLHPDLITDLVEPFLASDAPMGTLKRRIDSDQDLQNPGVVKVTTDRNGNALYFSRAPIPLVRDDPKRSAVPGLHFIHLGLYIYTRETLASLAALPTGILEEAEKLEQLRALENGIRIRVWETSQKSLRIDSPEDVPLALAQLRAHMSGSGRRQP